ncbi:MAG: hypothetical protein COZ18_05375 [Flexibacter sp. CG_4_10_14_3_um_filter_32_15]|nr:MAG: hypothetical protein COZ18_05375 [Flexibacter sp. CG_4_10_14_3_um_filter_32_15]
MKNYSLFILIILSSLLTFLFSCTNSLGKKGAWNATYKQEFLSNCKAEIQKEESLVKIDSLTISKICDCVADKAEKAFAPLEMEEKKSQNQMKTISTDCARDILIENLNKN